MVPSDQPDEWTPAPEPEPEEKRQTHEPMIGFPRFERAGGDNGSDESVDS